jgi:hypothetical protein
MREALFFLKTGDHLTARKLGQLVDVVERQSRSAALYGLDGTIRTIAVDIKLGSQKVEIAEVGLLHTHRVYLRNYTGTEWATDNSVTYELDVSEFTTGTYVLGTRLIAFWHHKRQAFVPVCFLKDEDEGSGGGGAETDSARWEQGDDWVWEEDDLHIWEDA